MIVPAYHDTFDLQNNAKAFDYKGFRTTTNAVEKCVYTLQLQFMIQKIDEIPGDLNTYDTKKSFCYLHCRLVLFNYALMIYSILND